MRGALGFGWLVLISLAGCPVDPPVEPPPTDFEARLERASSAPVLIQRDWAGRVLVVQGRIQVPDSVPADPESRGRWFLDEFGDELGLDDPAMDARVSRIVEGEAGTVEEGDAVVTFARTEDGLPVFGAEAKVEVGADGTVRTALSRIPPDIESLSPEPAIPQSEAEATALEAHPMAMIHTTELGFINVGFFRGYPTPSQLVYRVALAEGLDSAPVRFVDASTGDLLSFADSAINDARNREIYSYYAVCGGASTQVYAESGPIVGAATTADADAAYVQARQVWDYYWDTHRRDSHDGRGAPMISYTDYRRTRAGACDATYPNAFFDRDNDWMVFGEEFVHPDIYGHEYTHGVVFKTAGLPYEGQSGALNESFADVFGSALDENWQIGEGLPRSVLDRVYDGAGAIRDLSDPGLFCQPAHMNDLLDLDIPAPTASCTMHSDCDRVAVPRPCAPGVTRDPFEVVYQCVKNKCVMYANDHNGVHINSGIPNHVAYLAADGGPGPLGDVDVVPIGFEKVQHIWFRGLTWYLPESADFMWAKISIRLAAQRLTEAGLHGVTWEDCGSVLTAFGAVGIGTIDSDMDCYTDAVDTCPMDFNPDQTDRSACREPVCGGTFSACTDTSQCCTGLSCVNGDCVNCSGASGVGDVCDPAVMNACCGSLVCGRATDGTDTCCRSDGDPCSGDAECCGDMACSGGRCACRADGESCQAGRECCGGSFCDEGVCRS